MEIENHKEEVPFAHYEALFKDLDPQEALGRLPDVTFAEGAFQVKLLGRTFAITHPGCAFTALDGGALPPLPTRTFLLRYLLESKEVPFGGTWKTFREMPWGEMYIKPYTGRVLTRAAFTFGTRVNAFRAAAEKMGATKLPHGDEGTMSSPPTPRCCIPTTSPRALPPKIGWWRGISSSVPSKRICNLGPRWRKPSPMGKAFFTFPYISFDSHPFLC